MGSITTIAIHAGGALAFDNVKILECRIDSNTNLICPDKSAPVGVSVRTCSANPGTQQMCCVSIRGVDQIWCNDHLGSGDIGYDTSTGGGWYQVGHTDGALYHTDRCGYCVVNKDGTFWCNNNGRDHIVEDGHWTMKGIEASVECRVKRPTTSIMSVFQP